jgi:predicted ATP-grasp superfamily ATP-dependent carboligase
LEYLSIWLVTNGLLDDISIENVLRFETEYHDFMKRKNPKIIDELSFGQKPNETLIKSLEKSAQEFKKIFLTMATLLILKRRIKTTSNISKTTKAFQMIAASRLKKAQKPQSSKALC